MADYPLITVISLVGGWRILRKNKERRILSCPSQMLALFWGGILTPHKQEEEEEEESSLGFEFYCYFLKRDLRPTDITKSQQPN